MLDRTRFTERMREVAAAFEKRLDPATLDVYWRELRGVSDEEFHVAAGRAIASCQYFPRVKVLLEHVQAMRKAGQSHATTSAYQGWLLDPSDPVSGELRPCPVCRSVWEWADRLHIVHDTQRHREQDAYPVYG